MHEVCVGYGYCGSVQDGKPVHVGDFIPKDGAVTADQFVEWIFQAEDLDLAGGSASYKNAIREAFVRQMSADVVDAQMLHWSE